MNLEEMQSVWKEMTEKLDDQKHLTNKLIMDMTKEKFKNKISRIARYESLGALICFIGALCLILNIEKLDTWYLLGSGLLVLTYLIILPIIVLKYIKQMKNIDLVNNSYKQSLIAFTDKRRQFLLAQRVGIIANFFLMILILPVSSKLFNGEDLFITQSSKWIWYMVMMVIFLVPFSIWGYRKYDKMTATAENLLRDLESNT